MHEKTRKRSAATGIGVKNLILDVLKNISLNRTKIQAF